MKRTLIFVLVCALIILPVTVLAQSPTGVAVIGDSLSHEYRCKPRGNSTSYNWVEILGRERDVNFGVLNGNCYAYVYANSGSIIQQQMAGQVTSAINSANAGNTGKVISWIGGNDLLAGTPVSTLIATYTTQLDRLLTVYEPQNILIVGIPQNDCGTNNANTNNFNAQLSALAANRGVVYGDIAQFCILLNSYQINSSTYNYGGQSVNRWNYCYIGCLRLPDGHPGNIAQALFANSVMVDFLGIAPVSEADVLAMMGIGASPTATPTRTATPVFTSTPSRTPTPSLTPTITATSTPIILSCPVGYHWTDFGDPRSVECVPN